MCCHIRNRNQHRRHNNSNNNNNVTLLHTILRTRTLIHLLIIAIMFTCLHLKVAHAYTKRSFPMNCVHSMTLSRVRASRWRTAPLYSSSSSSADSAVHNNVDSAPTEDASISAPSPGSRRPAPPPSKFKRFSNVPNGPFLQKEDIDALYLKETFNEDLFRYKLLHSVKHVSYEQVVDVYTALKTNNYTIKSQIHMALLGVCTKYEHYEFAKTIRREMEAAGQRPTEPLYVTLVRCLCAGDKVEEALSLVGEMKDVGLSPKLRTYQPIVEAICRRNRPESALALLQTMQRSGVEPRSEQLSMVIDCAARTGLFNCSGEQGSDNDKFKTKLNSFIRDLSDNVILGFSSSEAATVVTAMQNQTREEFADDGILVQTVDDIKGLIIEDNRETSGSVKAVNYTFKLNYTGIEADIASNDSVYKSVVANNSSSGVSMVSKQLSTLININNYSLSSMERIANILKDNLNVQLDKLKADSKVLRVLSTADHEGAAVIGADNTTIDAIPILGNNKLKGHICVNDTVEKFFVKNSPYFQSHFMSLRNGSREYSRKARIVEVSPQTCQCPLCGDQLRRLLLTDDERKRVRKAITQMANVSNMQSRNLQNFSSWLSSKPFEYTYIVDGANVAYNRQNFETGKFSYKQIELVVDKLLQTYGADTKVLVLLPYAYAQKVVPNSAKNKGGRRVSYTTKEEHAILQRFIRDDMLYVVPQGANDDWYWIYSTVHEGRRNQEAFAVTNDLMRDHRLGFMEPRLFLRWRSTQIVHFDFSTAATSAAGEVDPETFLIPPPPFTREIQRTGSGRYHFPIVDRNYWMCLDLE